MSTADRRLCRLGNLENFCYLYVTIGGSASPKRHVQLYRPEQERCSPTDAMPDIDTITIIKRYPYQKSGLRIRNHYEEPAVECGTFRNGSIRQQLALRKRWSTDLIRGTTAEEEREALRKCCHQAIAG